MAAVCVTRRCVQVDRLIDVVVSVSAGLGVGGVAESREWFGRGRAFLVQHFRSNAGGRLGW